MTLDKIRQLYDAQPFRSFTLHLADGRAIPVLSPEFVMATPSGGTLIVCQPDDTLNIIDLLLVTDAEIKPKKNGQRKSNGRKKRSGGK